MDRDLFPNRETLKRFDALVEKRLSGVFAGDAVIFRKKDLVVVMVQERSLSHLDLAVRSRMYVHWTRRLMTVYADHLPHFCREHLLAERTPRPLKLLETYDFLLSFAVDVAQVYMVERNMVEEPWFVGFEHSIFKGISEKDDDQRASIIRRYLRYLERSSATPESRYRHIMPTLLEHCTNLDVDLTLEVLKAFCGPRICKLGLLNVAPSGRCLERLILQVKDLGFGRWGSWRAGGGMVLDFFELKLEKSKVLLQYGFPYAIDQAAFSDRFDTLRNIRIGYSRLILPSYVFPQYTEPEQRTRLMLILDTFIVFLQFRGLDFHDRVKTLVYLTRTLPLPYVTPTELEDTMRPAIDPEFSDKLDETVERYEDADIFEDGDAEFLEHGDDTYRPRRLMHLCRVVIRARLSDDFLDVRSIEELNIPSLFKEYLKLER